MKTVAFDSLAHEAAMRAAGYWRGRTPDSYLRATLERTPEKSGVIAYRADREGAFRLTYAELADRVAQAAASLRHLGVRKGDVVAIQLPNWVEFVIANLACVRIGAMANPLMPIFRERELSYMLAFEKAKVFIVPKTFRGHDHEAMAYRLQAQCPNLSTVIVVDGEGENNFDRLLLSGADRIDMQASIEDAPLQPNDTSVLMFTSGTTGSPKAVMHTSDTMDAGARSTAERVGLGADDVLLVCAPVAHMSGYAIGVILGLQLGATIVMQDVWDARRGIEVMAAEGVTYTAAATPFLSDLCEAVASGMERPRYLRIFICGGAPIPPVLVDRAANQLNLTVCSLWGMTEALGATITEPSRALEKSRTTDGCAVNSMDVSVVDEASLPVPNGRTGRLRVRGAQMCRGYLGIAPAETFDGDGWFDTGDLAYMDDAGYIRINGRTKDVLIRGGENVPVFEIESILHEHPAVKEAALVGFPDPRLGERGCVFVVAREGQPASLEELQRYLAERQVAKQYWPERLAVVTSLPRTPSGKIQKFILREMAAKPSPMSPEQ